MLGDLGSDLGLVKVMVLAMAMANGIDCLYLSLSMERVLGFGLLLLVFELEMAKDSGWTFSVVMTKAMGLVIAIRWVMA